MRTSIECVLSKADDDTAIVSLALGEAPAYNITSSFFAICSHVAELDIEEERIGSKLEEAVMAELTRRNDFAHGDWYIGWTSTEGEFCDPILWRVKPNRKKGAFSEREIPVAELDQASDEIAELDALLSEYGDLCLRIDRYRESLLAPGAPNTRVRDVFMIEGSRRSGSVIRRPDAPGPPYLVFRLP